MREGLGRSIMADQRHGEGFDATGVTLHARRTHRHASQCKSPGIRFLDQQPFDVLDRHMTLHEIAAALRGVAGILCGGHAQAGLYRLEFPLVSEVVAEASTTQVPHTLVYAHTTRALLTPHPRQPHERRSNLMLTR